MDFSRGKERLISLLVFSLCLTAIIIVVRPAAFVTTTRRFHNKCKHHNILRAGLLLAAMLRHGISNRRCHQVFGNAISCSSRSLKFSNGRELTAALEPRLLWLLSKSRISYHWHRRMQINNATSRSSSIIGGPLVAWLIVKRSHGKPHK